MKKLFLVVLLIPILLFGQPYQSPTSLNSTLIPLDSAGVWTGNIEPVKSDYVSMVITVFSDIGGTLKVEWARVDTKPVRYVAYDIRRYTAGDTVNNRFYFPVTLGYFRVTYTNGPTDQTSFKLTTTLIRGNILPTSKTVSNLYESTIAAGDSLGAVIKLAYNEIPAAVFSSDTLKNKADTTVATSRSLKFYVYIGDTSGVGIDVSKYFMLTKEDSANTDYAVLFEPMKMTPLRPTVFYPLIPDPSLNSYKGDVYIRPYFVGGIQKAVALKIKVRQY